MIDNLIFLMLITIIGFCLTLILTWILLPKIMKLMKKKGIVGKDIHKKGLPEIPEMGGLAIFISVIVSGLILFIISIIFYPQDVFTYQVLSFLFAIGISGTIGIVDDKYRLGGKKKPLLLALGGVPILLIHFFMINICNPFPYFPLIGSFTIQIIYFLIIPIAFSVISNAMNMLDVVNGSMTGSSVLIFFTLIITSFIFIIFPLSDKPGIPNSVEQGIIGLVIASVMLGGTLILYKYNKFPAKVFTGDVGSLTIGYGISAVAILGGQEFIVIICMLPFVINAFQMLSSIGKVVEGRKIKYRPTKVLSDSKIIASNHQKAPITLMRILLSKKPKSEKEIALDIILLTGFSCFLGIVSALLTIFVRIL
ncbi:MAG: hypothetical protein ACTSPY_05550 [Candidatus Helarchaeota archaeon]